jgi:predicted CxxxxCH...CXXCH cytochrome family protein
VWNAERNLDCQGCHGTPPPAPHPQLDDCARCHADVVAADNRTIVDRARHVDGNVDLTFDTNCNACHGDKASPAPPRDVSGNTSTSAPGVGAHRAHLFASDRARAVPCETCHAVPRQALAPGHIDTPLPAEVVLSGIPVGPGKTPRYEGGSCRETSCHGDAFADGRPSGGSHTTPSWTGGNSEAACGSCHGLPPPPPHPLPTYPCHSCHKDVAADDTSFTHPELHVDGVVTFQVP